MLYSCMLQNVKVVSICRLLDVVCLCLASLIPYSPSIVSLLTDFRECDVEWEPLVEVIFTAPALFSKPSPLTSQEAMPALTFGTLIAFANLCTSALGKVSHFTSINIIICLFLSIYYSYVTKIGEITGGKTHGNLIEIFQRSQTSFSIRRE